MKDRITASLRIDVDVDAWNAEYGTNDTATEIREQIKGSVLDAAKIAHLHLDHVVTITEG